MSNLKFVTEFFRLSMSLPNFLTLSRIFLTIIFAALLYQNSLWATLLAAVVFTVAALTDYYDGKIAKTRKLITDFGKLMDPIADKTLMLTAFFIFAQKGVIFVWMFGVIFLREVVVTVSRLLAARKGMILAAEKLGKIKTVLQIVSVSLILLFLIFEKSLFQIEGWYRAEDIFLISIKCLMFITVVVTLLSGVSYFKQKCKNSPVQSHV